MYKTFKKAKKSNRNISNLLKTVTLFIASILSFGRTIHSFKKNHMEWNKYSNTDTFRINYSFYFMFSKYNVWKKDIFN